jgi:hypothetical protein
MNIIMERTKFFLSLFLAFSLLIIRVGGVFAAPALASTTTIEGIVQSITLEADPTTGITTVIVHVLGSDEFLQSVRVSQEAAIALGLVVLNGDGKPVINDLALGVPVEIDPENVIPDKEENQHPVGSALTTFFSDIAGINYETIMRAHEQGVGFGVIAQTLWLTTKLEGNAETFKALLNAKQTGDYSDFVLEDGSTPKNWGQLRKAILDNGKKNSVGVVMSNSDINGHENKPEKDKNNNGNGNNGDKDKGKDKNKE